MLAFSDHRLGQSLLASPLLWLGVVPIAAYNVVFLATFPLCALAAHATAFTLTKRHDASVLCGLAYGFNPFRVAHISHLELLAAFGMPAALAALHMFLNDRRLNWVVVFAVAVFVQGLSASYYLLFFSVVLALWMPWFVRKYDWPAAMAILAGSACAVVALGPLAIGYWRIHAHYGFVRGLDEVKLYSADVTSLATASTSSALWHWTAHLNPGAERQLFPGLTISALAVVGLVTAISRHRGADNRWRLVSTALLVLATVYAGIALALIWLGPWSVTLAGLRIGATDVFKPISVALVALVAACAFQPWARAAWRGRSSLAFYLLAAGFLFLCSFGPAPTFLGEQILYKPPYAWLMNLPLFAGSVRAPARFAMPAILALSVAGALAFNRLKLAESPRRVLAAVLMAGIIADGWIGDLPLPGRPDMWRAPRDFRYGAVLELPLGDAVPDLIAMYRTIQHGHPTVNGNSGYFPPHYYVMQLALKENDPSVLGEVTPRGDPLLVVLDKQGDSDSRWNGLITAAPRATAVASDDHWAYFSIPSREPDAPCLGTELDIAAASDRHGPIDVSIWKDHSPKTFWTSKTPQQAGDAVLLDLGHEVHVCAIRMSTADSWHVYPRSLTVSTSKDGRTWADGFAGSTAGLAVRGALERPKDIWLDVRLRPVSTTRFIRLRLETSHELFPWFIPDLQVIGMR
jgi:hypothetical protein